MSEMFTRRFVILKRPDLVELCVLVDETTRRLYVDIECEDSWASGGEEVVCRFIYIDKREFVDVLLMDTQSIPCE